MTALPARSAPAPRRRTAPTSAPQRRLHPAPAPDTHAGRGRQRLGYAIVAVGAVALIVVAQLLFSIALAQGAYDIDRLRLQQVELAREKQELAEDLGRLESPQYLAMNAEALGMVPNAAPVYLRLSDGAVLGEPTAARAGAEASGGLVPNALIDGVPPVAAARQAGGTPYGGAGTEAPTGGSGTQVAPPPRPVTDELPTPATH